MSDYDVAEPAIQIAAPEVDELEHLEFLGDVYLPRPCELDLGEASGLICNLEHAITRCACGYPGKINLKSEEDHLTCSFGSRLAAVCLANNHIMDYGEQGLEDTIACLHASGIPSFGVGRLSENCGNPLLLDVGGCRVGLMGYVCPSTSAVFAQGTHPGVRAIDIDVIRKDIASARAMGAERIVVCLHWGCEQVYMPKPEDIHTSRHILYAGADLIIGHHAHRIQPFEIRDSGYVFYGLGNCIMPDLDVPSFYDEHGEPTRRFLAKQSYINRCSLAVGYHPGEGLVQVSVVDYSDGRLTRSSTNPRRYLRSLNESQSYERIFRRSYNMGKCRSALASWLAQPKLPRVSHIKSILSTCRSTEFK
ncbi:MAG: CapA family protein [Armatimonadota bacterium]